MRCKLSEEQVLEIYSYRWNNKEMADDPLVGKSDALSLIYNITAKAIRDIWNRRTWSHITSAGLEDDASADAGSKYSYWSNHSQEPTHSTTAPNRLYLEPSNLLNSIVSRTGPISSGLPLSSLGKRTRSEEFVSSCNEYQNIAKRPANGLPLQFSNFPGQALQKHGAIQVQNNATIAGFMGGQCQSASARGISATSGISSSTTGTQMLSAATFRDFPARSAPATVAQLTSILSRVQSAATLHRAGFPLQPPLLQSPSLQVVGNIQSSNPALSNIFKGLNSISASTQPSLVSSSPPSYVSNRGSSLYPDMAFLRNGRVK